MYLSLYYIVNTLSGKARLYYLTALRYYNTINLPHFSDRDQNYNGFICRPTAKNLSYCDVNVEGNNMKLLMLLRIGRLF